MTDERREEAEDLDGYEVLGAADTLAADPGDDPLDAGVIAPDRWSPGMRFGSTAAEEAAGESLDQLLAEEEPDTFLDLGDERSAELDWDENATEQEISRFARADGADPRAGRLVADDEIAYEEDDAYLTARDELVARDTGIDGAAASAEEAAVHIVNDYADSQGENP
ncbi:MAG: hypothetical protein J2P28_02700 [Actinobacteria bacterium]|nr:hypothetical protein [Actinomycetota bacterium]